MLQRVMAGKSLNHRDAVQIKGRIDGLYHVLNLLINRLEKMPMSAMDDFAAAFERHTTEISEVKEALRELARKLAEKPDSDPTVDAKLREFAARLDVSTEEIDMVTKEVMPSPEASGFEPAPVEEPVPAPVEEVPVEEPKVE